MLPFADLDRLKTELDALRPLAPEQEARVLQKFRLEWNYNSNAIEGNSLTLGETRSLLLHGLTAAGKPMRDHLDIRGHNEAVGALEDFVRSEYPLTEQFMREMHQLLLGEPYHTPAQTAGGQPTRKLIVPGRYKTSPNNVLTATGEMFYFASVEETPGRMTDLVDWYRAEEAALTLPPVALAAEFHYRFVRIHVFDDGNGRMSRLLMNLILLRHGYPMTVIKAEDRNRYLAALAAADAGEPEPFLRFIIENVEASLRLMIRAAKGESIDEPSDLDKKLALLKKQLKTREEYNRSAWHLTNQKRFFSETLDFWLQDITTELERFDELFFSSEIYIDAIDVSRVGFTRPEFTHSDTRNKHTVFEVAQKLFINSDRLLKETSIYFHWKKLLDFSYPFSVGAHVKIEFSEHNYTAEFAVYERLKDGMGYSSQKILSATYATPPIHSDIHTLNHQLANKVYDFIAAKLAEADTPPA